MDFFAKITADHIRNEAARRSLLRYCQNIMEGFQTNWHHKIICDAVQNLIAGRGKRNLMIFAPPRHGKSQICTRSAPAWFLGNYPDKVVISTSYNAELSWKMARDTANQMLSPRYRAIFPEIAIGQKYTGKLAKKSVFRRDEFEINGHIGGYRATGVGGGVTGMGFDLGIIDDPYKDASQALSATQRDRVWDWYVTSFSTRRMPGGKILLIMTRWHNDDLAGRLLTHEGDQWDVVALPGLSNRGTTLMPADPRDPSKPEPLWPERYPLAFHEQQLYLMGDHWYSAMYDQQPIPMGSGLFITKNIRRFSEDHTYVTVDGVQYLPHSFRYGAAMDLACTEDKRGDYTAIVFFRVGDKNQFLVDEVCRERVGIERLPAWVASKCAKHPRVRQMAVEADGFQKSMVKILRGIEGMPSIIEAKTSSKSKMERAIPAITRMANGQVYFPEGVQSWEKDFINELELFTGNDDSHDDMVDAFSHAVQMFAMNKAVRPPEPIIPEPDIAARIHGYFNRTI